jgi:hypothetical protein
LCFLTCKCILSRFMRFHSALFDIWSGQKILKIFRQHLLVKKKGRICRAANNQHPLQLKEDGGRDHLRCSVSNIVKNRKID